MTQPHYSLDLVPFDFWLFPKFKSPLKGKRFQTINEIQEIWWGSWWCFQQRILQSVLNSGKDTGRTVWSSKMPTLKGTEVHCPMYNISSLINAFIFHIAWLDTFKQTSYVSRSGIGGSCGPHSLSTWSSTCHLYWPFFFRMPMFKLNPDTSYPQIHSLGKWPPQWRSLTEAFLSNIPLMLLFPRSSVTSKWLHPKDPSYSLLSLELLKLLLQSLFSWLSWPQPHLSFFNVFSCPLKAPLFYLPIQCCFY